MNYYQLTIGNDVKANSADLRAYILLKELGVNFCMTLPSVNIFTPSIREFTDESDVTTILQEVQYGLNSANADAFPRQVVGADITAGHSIQGNSIPNLVVSAYMGYSLKNIETPNLQTLMYDSSTRETLERFDNGNVQKGDIVAVYVDKTKTDSIKKWYDDFTLIQDAGIVTENSVTKRVDMLYGVSNTTKSNIAQPFAEAIAKVSVNPEFLQTLKK